MVSEGQCLHYAELLHLMTCNSSDRLFGGGVPRSGQRDFAAAGYGCGDGGLFLFPMR